LNITARMKICLVGLSNLPALAPEFRNNTVGGESVQQTLLARALARRGHDVSMVVADYGQPDGADYENVRVFKAYRFQAGIPVLRFIHPRWTRLWSAMMRADADLYYTSCAGMQVGVMAMFCRYFGKRFIFRTASDSDCDKSRLLVQYRRDRWFYQYGLRRADAILVQSAFQARTLLRSYGLYGRIAGMLVEAPLAAASRDIDLLWLGNIRKLKRPDRVLELADQLPEINFHMAGGPLPGEESLYSDVRSAATARANVTFHGPLSYWAANEVCSRAKLLLNTSDVEGFPNTYLQAWIRGVPVVTLIDPDHVIANEGLGATAGSPAELPRMIKALLNDPGAYNATRERCTRFMAREFAEDKILATYLDAFERILHTGHAGSTAIPSSESPHA
jgi:glycosyltransferase involved in cell wall biosynthesis